MPGLVLELARQEHLVVLGDAEQQRSQLDRDLALPVMEAGGDRQERGARVVGHALGPVGPVLGEVELVDVPALPEIPVVELPVSGDARRRDVDVVEHIVDVGPAEPLEVLGFDAIQPSFRDGHAILPPDSASDGAPKRDRCLKRDR